MKLTNPSLTRGLGKTGSPNRRGLLTGAPTIRGLADTATPHVRDPGKGGQPLKVTQLVSVLSSGTISADGVETTIQTLAIIRALGSDLDINAFFEHDPIQLAFGENDPFDVAVKIKRAGTTLFTASFQLPVTTVGGAEFYSGTYFVPFVDADAVTGEATYTVTLKTNSLGGVGKDVTIRNRYIRLLERRL